MRSAKSADKSGGGDDLKNGDKLCIVLAAERAIENVGITSVSRIKLVNDLRNEKCR